MTYVELQLFYLLAPQDSNTLSPIDSKREREQVYCELSMTVIVLERAALLIEKRNTNRIKIEQT
jgi:hypothetical protein